MATNKVFYFFDLDHTLADSRERDAACGPRPPRSEKAALNRWLDDWRRPGTCLKDKVCEDLWPFVFAVSALPSVSCFYLTSRDESMRGDTERWLDEHSFPRLPLLMRSKTDWRSGGEMKHAKIAELVGHGRNKVVVVDDDEDNDLTGRVVGAGWTMLQVSRG